LAGALIVTAELGPADFAWLDGLRRQHYPAERNRVPAHLTLFHALPPSAEQEVKRSLARACMRSTPIATLTGLMDLGNGVAFRIRSEELDRLREELAAEFHGLLGAQDGAGWVPHVTIQNKVARGQARKLLRQLETSFQPRPLAIAGLQLFRYLDSGEWEALGRWSFRRSS
jgi:2'-5' RNA ligase